LDINKRFLNHDYYTDILTFVFSEANDPVDGEIYISLDRVKENSKTYKSSFTYELHRVVFHGVLHLSGYSDKDHKNAAIMRSMEEKYLSLYNHVSRET
jgi:probable rRNA maturation factor